MNDTSGQAFHALLDTECAAPFCLSPNRGYRTVIPDNVLPTLVKTPQPVRLERSSSSGMVEPHPLLFGFHPYAFRGSFTGANPRGPQHSPSALAPAFRFSDRQDRSPEKPQLA